MAFAQRLLPALCLLLSAGCNKELPLPAAGGEQKLVLIGELVAGESFAVRGGQSAAVGGSASTLQTPRGMTLEVTTEDGARSTLTGSTDSLSAALHTVAFSMPETVRNGARYTLAATHPSLAGASAVVEVPEPFSATLTDTVRSTRFTGPVLEARIRIDDAPGEHYYIIEAVKQPMMVTHEFFWSGSWRAVTAQRALYDSLRAAGVSPQERSDTVFSNRPQRIEIYTEDAVTENVQAGQSAPTPYRRILLADRRFNGQSYATTVAVRSDAFVARSPDTRGRVRLQVKSVPKVYFDFLKRYERYNPDAPAEPDALQGNVVGGYGAVGGAARVEWVWTFDRW